MAGTTAYDGACACGGLIEASPPVLLIDVTAEDIAHGTPRHCSECPVALAVRRALERHGIHAVNVRAGADGVSWELLTQQVNRAVRRALPPTAIWFIMSFDRGFRSSQRPFTFGIEL